MKKEKSCNTCAKRKHSLCDKDALCSNYVDHRASCIFCKNVNSCRMLDKHVGNLVFCSLFELGTKQNRKEFDDYKEWKESREEKPKEKKKKKKKAESPVIIKKFKSNLDSNIDTNKEDKDNKDDLWSPVNIVDEVISSNYDPRVFQLVQDGDMPRSTNIMEFISGEKFLNTQLFPKQQQIALNFFASYCPHCSDRKFLRKQIKVDTNINNIYDRTVLYKNGICPKCKSNRYEDIQDGYHNLYDTMALCVGQRSGKSALVWVTNPAIIHEYLQMPNPVKFLGLMPNTVLHSTFVGLRYQDAYDNIWEPMYKLIIDSPWYRQYHKLLDAESVRLGMELYKVRDTYISYTYKGIVAYPSGPDNRKLRGRTRISTGMDEPGWMTGSLDSVKYNAQGVFDALDNSLLTVRAAVNKRLKHNPGLITAYNLNTSSPRSKLDFITTLYKKSKKSNNIYGVHLPTWEFNPTITKQDLADKFRNDPISAERDFGANPPYSSSPFISSPALVIPTVGKKANCLKIVKYDKVKDSMDKMTLCPRIIFKEHGMPSVLSIDAGYSNNSFAMALMNLEEPKVVDNNENVSSLVVRISGLLEIQPEDGLPLNFPAIYKRVICPILTSFNVTLVVFDRWQSINLRQSIYTDHNIDAIQNSPVYSNFEDLRMDISSTDIFMPKLEQDVNNIILLDKDLESIIRNKPVSHYFLQLITSLDTGRTVTKAEAEGMTDDILRAVVNGHAVLRHEDFIDYFTGEEEQVSDKGSLGYSVSLSNAGTNTSVPGLGIVIGGSR